MDHRNKRIVIIEDNENIRDMYGAFLRLGGFSNFHIYGSVTDFFTNERNMSQVDFFILDQLLPGDVSGLEIARRIREEYTLKTPIILSTALNDASLPINYVDAVFLKPLEIRQFLDKIKELLERGENSDLHNENRQAPIA